MPFNKTTNHFIIFCLLILSKNENSFYQKDKQNFTFTSGVLLYTSLVGSDLYFFSQQKKKKKKKKNTMLSKYFTLKYLKGLGAKYFSIYLIFYFEKNT